MQDIVVGIVEQDGQFPFLLRADEKTWTFPCGKTERDESIDDAVAREVFEKTGLIVNVDKKLGEQQKCGIRLHFCLCSVQMGHLSKPPEAFLKAEWKSAAEILKIWDASISPSIRDYLSQKLG